VRRGYLLGLIIIAVVLALIGTTLFSPPPPANENNENNHTAPPAHENGGNEDDPEPEIRSATILAVGDIMGHRYQVEQAQVVNADGSVSYNFRPSFDFIAPYLMEPDLTVGVLETTLAGAERGYSYYPNFNTPEELAANLKDAGFDLLATATNHSLDKGISGLQATIENLRAAGLENVGTYLSPEEQQTPLIKDLNGIKVAFLAYTETTNGIPVPAGHEYAINFIPGMQDISPLMQEIERARAAGADIVAVLLHWGPVEYQTTPTDFQRQRARQIIEAGADLILGSHVHIIQPLEWITVQEGERAGRKALVAYSMGNFFTNQHYSPGPPNYIPSPGVQCGLMVQVELQKDTATGEAVISDAGYRISWVHRHWQHRILPVDEVIERGREQYNLNEEEFQEMQSSTNQMIAVVENYGFSGENQ